MDIGFQLFSSRNVPLADWKTLFPIIKAKTRAKYFIAEHDNPSDIDRFTSRSIASLKALGA